MTPLYCSCRSHRDVRRIHSTCHRDYPARSLFIGALVLLSLVSFFAPSAPAQESAGAPSRLVSVSAKGSRRFSSEQIAAVTGLHPGTMITREDFQRGADVLAALGPFVNVQYRFSTIATGVTVEFDVADAPALPVAFDNFPWFSDDELSAAIKAAVGLYDGSAPETGTILESMAGALARLLDSRNVQGTVSHSVELIPATDQRIQQFRVEGVGLRVQAVEFSDTLARVEPSIQQRISDLVGKPYSRSAVEIFEFDHVRPVYLAHGMLHVQFNKPIARFSGDPRKPLPDHVVVAAPIVPGPIFKWSGVDWSGNSAISSADLDTLIPFKPGETADGVSIAALWERIRDAYGKKGYLDVDLKPVPALDERSSRVSYLVTISEGRQYHMGKLVLTGLSIEGERRIRAAWRIAPGDVFDANIYFDFLSTGIKQAFTGLPVHYDKIGRFLQKDPQTAEVDVLLDFQ